MKKKTTIEVKVNIEDIKELLKQKVDFRYSDIIVDVIMSNLAKSPVGLEQLFRAMNGIAPRSKFQVGDKVLVNMNTMTTWNKDQKLMEDDASMTIQGKLIAQIYSIDLQDNPPYTLEFEAYDNSGARKTFMEGYHEQYIEFRPEDFMED